METHPECCLLRRTADVKKASKIIAVVYTVIELLEILRVALVTEWLLISTWDKTVVLELLLLVLLLVTNMLLYHGVSSSQHDNMLPWLVVHGLGLVVVVIGVVYCVVDIAIMTTPGTQTWWLGLPQGMGHMSPEVQQRLRRAVGVALARLFAFLLLTGGTVYSLLAVRAARRLIKEEMYGITISAETKTGVADQGAKMGGGGGAAASDVRRQQYPALQRAPHRMSYKRGISQDTSFNVPSIASEREFPEMTEFKGANVSRSTISEYI